MKKDRKKILMVILGIIAFFVLLNLVTYRSTTERVVKYITRLGYQNDGESSLYSKQITDINLDQYFSQVEKKSTAKYEVNYFNVKEYQFIKNVMEYSDGIESTFSPKYDYKVEKLSYTYRIVIRDSSSVIFEGEYDASREDFTCENTYMYQFDLIGNEEALCNKIRFDVENFYYEMRKLITNPSLIEKMRGQ